MNQEDLNNLWQQTLEILKTDPSVSNITFDTFIKSLNPRKIEDNTFILETLMPGMETMIETKYSAYIAKGLFLTTGKNYSIKIVSEGNDITPIKKEIKRDDNRGTLLSHYTFDTFVVGNSNRLAHAAALAVADAPGVIYNPLFLYGGVGLGKTHLMQSIAHYILSQKPDTKIVYVSSEKFVNDFVNAIQNNRNAEFRNAYRNIDVLLIDDIQFISDKEGTQEEFFHTFNALYEANKQIIMSSDRPPKELKNLEDRLCSRFEWGLSADIKPPDYETRLAILNKKAETENFEVPFEVMDFIAKSINSNIRELEGALTKIKAYAKLTNLNQPITLELATNVLRDLLSHTNNTVIDIDFIQQIVATYYNIKPEELKSPKRTKEIVYPRQIAMYLCRKHTDLSLPKIGEAFGGRDHTTIIHGCEKISSDLKNNDALKNVINILEKKITG